MRFLLRATAVVLAVALSSAGTPAGAAPEYMALTLAPLPQLPPLPTGANSLLIRDALNSANKYLLNTWWAERMEPPAPYDALAARLVMTGSVNDEEIRRFSSAAFSVATALATGAYDANVTGVPEATARQRAVDLVAVGVRTYRHGSPLFSADFRNYPAWGKAWQSALWASQFALAGWLLRDALPTAERVLIARMLEGEADTIEVRRIEYIRDVDGKVIRKGNSGADEVAWDAVAIYTAVEMLPRSTRRSMWADNAYKRFLSSYAVPLDVRSNDRVNGRQLKKWITGSNVEPAGWVVNHGKLNPDYTVGFTPHAVVVSGLAGVGYPNAIRHNQDLLYRNVAEYVWAVPPGKPPGGTVYVPGKPDIYYPRGPDWGTHRQDMFATWDVEMSALGLDRGLRTPAATWARRHLEQVRFMQRRFATGQLYGPLSENRYFAREEHAGALFAYAHLTDVLASAKRLYPDDREPRVKSTTG